MSIIDRINKKFSPEIHNNELIITDPKTNTEFYFDIKSDEKNILANIKMIDFCKYMEGQAFFYEDYFEIPINLSNAFFIDSLSQYDNYSIGDTTEPNSKVYYDVGTISDLFKAYLKNSLPSDWEIDDYVTLKIYNINKICRIQFDDTAFFKFAVHIVKSLFFQISAKHDLNLSIVKLCEEGEEDDPFWEILDGVEIDPAILEREYDKDLIYYYYRANQLSDNEFRYLAYFQVVECLFDEVFNFESIQDVRSIINSYNFNADIDGDVFKIIEIVDRFSKHKDDRYKTYLVLKKYFKGEVHDEAFFESNKDIFDLMKNDLSVIDSNNDFKDLQKISNIIYEYRCICTHSNRQFKTSIERQIVPGELAFYIKLIKKIASKIIINYRPTK